MGNGSVIRKGEIQRMTAGTGVTHSEYNHSDKEIAHFLQIWIFPEKKELQPGYEQKYYSDLVQPNNLVPIASPDAMGHSVKIHQDAKIYTSILENDNSIKHDIDLNRHVWLHTIKGNLNIDGENLLTGDSCGISEEALIAIQQLKRVSFYYLIYHEISVVISRIKVQICVNFYYCSYPARMISHYSKYSSTRAVGML